MDYKNNERTKKKTNHHCRYMNFPTPNKRNIRLYTVSKIMMMAEDIVRNATNFSETHVGRNGMHLLDG
jgi:hypothetical protein